MSTARSSSQPAARQATLQDPLRPELPGPRQRRQWGQLYGDAAALAIAAAAESHPGPVVVVTADAREVDQMVQQLAYFSGKALPLLAFPDWETLPYDAFSPHQDILSQRIETLYRLPELKRGLLVLPAATLLQRLPPRSYLSGSSLMVEVGERLDIEAMRRRFEQAGYGCVSQVMEHGEFAVRGSLFDIYPMGAALPFRIDLFDDEVESIRTFDPETQRSIEKVAAIHMLPAREYPFDEEAIGRFRQAWRSRFEGDPQHSLVYRDVSGGITPGGIEYYLPLFFEQTETFADYLPEETLLVRLPGADEAAEAFWKDLGERYEQRRHDRERPLLPPQELFLEPGELARQLAALARIDVTRFEHSSPDAERHNYASSALPDLAFQARSPRPAARLREFLERFAGRTLITAESAGRRESLRDVLRDYGLKPRDVDGWQDFLASEDGLALGIAPLERGLQLPGHGIALVTETQLFGRRVQQARRRKTARDAESIIRDLTDLAIGAPVVHEDHGVGRYLGLQKLEVGNSLTEFLALEYAGGDKLYVPVASLHLISRYTGTSPEEAPLHKLGSEQWARARRKAAERVRDVAAELLEIQARRAARSGHAFEIHTEEYRQFAAAFPFEETPDQAQAIEAVLADLAAPQPMDRVVCGDVGFGKTEVAMRAAFVAASGGRQVAVLVPTTLLAQQHFQNFRDRMADWPLRIEVLSRFAGGRQQQAVIEGLAEGSVDIVIGTHKLLQEGIRFKNLGLVIIDEEHRFGVRQKERFKALRAEVDLLTLTATPIPRTLNMSLAGLRDLSIIATPPAQRLAIKTFVCEWDKATIREACLREIKRGGQVYFLHNQVESIERIARELGELLPEASIAIGHGQMRERELEQVMLDFYHRRFNLLVCTTIIESGIDVPTANTILINRADKLGLAQLHQLRGRVGRSHHRAYAYLIVPPRRAMTADAIKRLEAVESLEELGAGFSLATHDLEIRGAGELLGDEQSGQIQEIGFSLYSELLERAVKSLKAGGEPQLDRPLDHGAEIELGIPALIPDDYLPDVHARLILYKRIASAATAEALRELQVEMIDRFGLLPEAVKNLFAVTALKLRALPLGIRKIDAGERAGRIRFSETPAIDPARIVQLIQTQPQAFSLSGADSLRFFAEMLDAETRLAAVGRVLDALQE
ncbi:transcription-repair coupling factor [Thiohalobacter sp. IOR34]|uniref:transcription-repair coupling factor n=1 Tax=Thiohalobacter sp. IOR34 TaxID=3057176 RepID=UPI0025B03933|nr:transcription-repair coupling factor [Thiohalobacter sp. IOR34]WJW76761.1 transcription-repair coupling factor [Thiohalobacter sp. IOR34]